MVAAPTLVSCDGNGRFSVVPYPCDTAGMPIPADELYEYNTTHEFVDNIYCMCEYVYGTPRPVRVVRPRSGEHEGSVCLGCPDWQLGGADTLGRPAGCRYFVNINAKFWGNPSWANVPLKEYPLRQGPYTTPRRLRSSVSAPSSQAASEGGTGSSSQDTNTGQPQRLQSPVSSGKLSSYSALASWSSTNSVSAFEGTPASAGENSGVPLSLASGLQPRVISSSDPVQEVECNSEDAYIIPATKEARAQSGRKRKRSIGLPPGFYPPEVEMQARSAKRARDGLRTCALPRISVAARSSTLGESSKNAIQNTEATTGWDSDATVTTDADAAATTQRPSAPSTQAVVREVIEVSSGEEDNTTAVARKVINVSSGEDEDEVIIRNGPPPSTTHCPLLIARARRGVGDCVPQPPRQDRAPDVIGSEARANDVPAAPAGTLPNANAVHTLSGHLGPGAMYGHPFLPGAVYAQPPLAPHLGMPVAQPYFPYGSQFGFYMLPAPPMYNHMYATTMKDQCAPAPSITPAAGNSSNNSVLAPPPLHLVALPQNTFLMPGAGATPHIAGDPTRRVPANPTPPAAVDAAPGIVDALPRVVISAATPPPVIPGVGTSSQQPASGAPGAVLARNSEVASSPSNAFAK